MTNTAPEPVLTLDQLRRVEALQRARDVLANKNVWSGTNVAGFTVGDLTYLAEWITDGPADSEPQAWTTYYERGWKAARIAVLTEADVAHPAAAVDWIAEHETPEPSVQPAAMPTFTPPSQDALTNTDAAATADLNTDNSVV